MRMPIQDWLLSRGILSEYGTHLRAIMILPCLAINHDPGMLSIYSEYNRSYRTIIIIPQSQKMTQKMCEQRAYRARGSGCS